MTDNKPLSAPQLPRGYFARLVANGYAPIPTADKRCFTKKWQAIPVDAAQARLWDRSRKWPGIGLRIEPPLCVIDLDVFDEGLMAGLRAALAAILPDGPGLERIGNAPKAAFFLRYGGDDGAFNKRQSRQWSFNPDDKASPKFRVELYAGGSARYFGAFGPHEHDAQGNVLRTYQWPGASPLDTPLADLPVLSREQSYAICDAADGLFKATPGLKPIAASRGGDAVSAKLYDLTDEMTFSDGRSEWTLDDLIVEAGYAKARGRDFRISGSFLNEPDSRGDPRRCIVDTTRDGLVRVFDTRHGVNHYVEGTAPNRLDASTDEGFAELIRRMNEPN